MYYIYTCYISITLAILFQKKNIYMRNIMLYLCVFSILKRSRRFEANARAQNAEERIAKEAEEQKQRKMAARKLLEASTLCFGSNLALRVDERSMQKK